MTTTKKALVQTLLECGATHAFTLPGLGITWMHDEFYEVRDRFLGEGRILAQLRHPALVAVTDVLDVPPDRIAINPRSEFFDEDKLMRGIGIRFKGVVRTNIEEYCISEGWVRVQAGKTMDRKGQPLTLKLSGPVEAWFEDLGEDAPVLKA